MNKGAPLVLWGAALGLLAVGAIIWASSGDATRKDEQRGTALDSAQTSPLARESKSLLSPTLKNVYFGMTQPQLQAARPRATRKEKADEPRFFMFEEKLSPHERVLYGIDAVDLRLTKVQITGVLSRLKDVPERIALMQGRYGMPTGIVDCPAAPGQLPTRRFVFRRSALGVMDSFLIIGDRIAVTLYVAPWEIIQESLSRAKCAPTPKAAMTRFPAVPLDEK